MQTLRLGTCPYRPVIPAAAAAPLARHSLAANG
jgi:hypothetical protein